MSNQMSLEEMVALFDTPEPEGFITTDLSTDVIDSLKLVELSLGCWKADASFAVKWGIISAHAAANTALVNYLSGSFNVGALDQRLIEKHQEALEEGYPLPLENRVVSFNRLLERAVDLSKRQESIPTSIPGENALEISIATKDSLSILNALRDRFIHRRPSGWIVEKSYALGGIQAGLDLVIAINEEAPFWDHNNAYDEIKNLCEQCQNMASNLN